MAEENIRLVERKERNTNKILPKSTKDNSYAEKTSYLIFVLVTLFVLGVGNFYDSVWIESPTFVQRLPEYWNLPSYTVFISGFGALISTSLYATKKCQLNRQQFGVVILMTLVLSTISCVAMIFCWDKTAIMFGKSVSVGYFFSLLFGHAGNCGTSILSIAFMAFVPAHYLPAYYAGEGLPGLMSILGIIQGSGSYSCVWINGTNITSKAIKSNSSNATYSVTPVYNELRFSVETFLAVTCVTNAISLLSFCLLNFHPGFKTLYENSHVSDLNDFAENDLQCHGSEINTNTYRWLMFVGGTVLGLYYKLIFAVQSFCTLSYDTQTFNVVNRVSIAVVPLSAVAASKFYTSSIAVVNSMFFVMLACIGYILTAAAMSPAPPFKDSTPLTGKIIMVSRVKGISNPHTFFTK